MNTISTAPGVTALEAVYNELTREIGNKKHRIDVFDGKKLSEAEIREYDNLQDAVDELEEELDAVDRALSLIDPYK